MKKNKVLDLACGTGALTGVLLKRFPKIRITAVDLNKIILKYYKNNYSEYIKKGQVRVIKGNIEEIDTFLNEKYDYAFISSAFWDIETRPIIFSVFKILSKKGVLVFNLSKINLSQGDGFIYLLEKYFKKEVGKIARYRRINLNYLYGLCKRRFSIKRKEYRFELSRTNVKKFFEVLIYRYPFIFFRNSKKAYKERERICKHIFNKILNENKKFEEVGEIFILKKI